MQFCLYMNDVPVNKRGLYYVINDQIMVSSGENQNTKKITLLNRKLLILTQLTAFSLLFAISLIILCIFNYILLNFKLF